MKLWYCPVFPSSKSVLQFCLAAQIPFDPQKIDYLYGDFKDDPLLSDGETKISESNAILRYLCEKFCVPSYWYPSGPELTQQESQRRSSIDQWLEWR